jgi:hypothetical protein
MANTIAAYRDPAEASKLPEPRPSKTPLGKRLSEIRERIVASGVPLLDDAELARERADRRGDNDTDLP